MDPYTRALEMVRLAPSASNKQPWRMVREKNTDVFHLFLQRTKGYHENNSKWFGLMDMQRVDMGIAMSHFELACREEGVEGGWTELKPGNPKIAAIPELTQYVATWTKS
jgi:nitroreductase